MATTWQEHRLASGRLFWQELAEKTRGNVSLMAQVARVRRSHVYIVLRRFGVKLPAERPESRQGFRRGNWGDLSPPSQEAEQQQRRRGPQEAAV